jgi:hypothetical protein
MVYAKIPLPMTVKFVEGPVADFVANSYNVATNIMFTLTDNTKGNPIICYGI